LIEFVKQVAAVAFVGRAREEEVMHGFMSILARWANRGVSGANGEKMLVKGGVTGT
jgi:hypothetical protein